MKIIRLKEVITITGLGRSTIYAKMSVQEFPKNISLSQGDARSATGWVESEVFDWINERIQERNQLLDDNNHSGER